MAIILDPLDWKIQENLQIFVANNFVSYGIKKRFAVLFLQSFRKIPF